jgi:hypothetical protein
MNWGAKIQDLSGYLCIGSDIADLVVNHSVEVLDFLIPDSFKSGMKFRAESSFGDCRQGERKKNLRAVLINPNPIYQRLDQGIY